MDLNQVTVQSINIFESIKFYKKLGLILIVEDKHYAKFEFPKGNSTLSVHFTTNEKLSNRVIYFEVNDVVKVVANLKTKGAKLYSKPSRRAVAMV